MKSHEYAPGEMVTLYEARVSGTSPSVGEQQGFEDALGTTTCTNSVIARSVEFFALALAATVVYVILQLPSVDAWFTRYIPDFEYRLATKALLFFVIVYLLDRLVIRIRNEIELCDFRDF
jgi:hypothetical protein